MSGPLEWLLKLLFIVMLAPFLVCLFVQIFITAAVAILPWVLGLAVLVGLTAGVAAGLTLRRLLTPGHDRVPPGEIPRTRRPKGFRTER